MVYWKGDGVAGIAIDAGTAKPTSTIGADGELTLGDNARLLGKSEGCWGDLPIGAVFAGGKNGELLEVIDCPTQVYFKHCPECYYHQLNDDTCGKAADGIGPWCAQGGRKDRRYVHFVKLKRNK